MGVAGAGASGTIDPVVMAKGAWRLAVGVGLVVAVAGTGCRGSRTATSGAGTKASANKALSGEPGQIIGVPFAPDPVGSGAGNPGGAVSGAGQIGGQGAGTGSAAGGSGPAGAPGGCDTGGAPPARPSATTTPPGTRLEARPDEVVTAVGLAVVVVPLANDLHPPGHALSVDSPSPPAHGTADIEPGGKVLRYVPAAGYSGSDSFTYVAVDGSSRSQPGTVSVQVVTNPSRPGGKPVVARSGRCTTVFAPSNLAGPLPFVISGVTAAAHGALHVDPQGGRLDYAPAAGYHGTDGFSVTLTDGVHSGLPAAFAIKVP